METIYLLVKIIQTKSIEEYHQFSSLSFMFYFNLTL